MREENVEWGVGGENYASCGTVDVSYLLFPTSSKEMQWLAKRPRDSSLSVEKAKQTLKNKPLQISEALSRLKTEMS